MNTIIVSDFQIVSEAISCLLVEGGFATVAQVKSIEAKYDNVDFRNCDVIILTEPAFETSVASNLKKLHELSNGVSVILVSLLKSPSTPFSLLFKYSLKAILDVDSGVADLHGAVRNASDGRSFITQEVAQQLAADLATPRKKGAKLTTREEEIFLLIAEGLSTTEIGERLSLNSRTVSTHKFNIKNKLCLDSTSSIVQYALEQGWIRPRLKG